VRRLRRVKRLAVAAAAIAVVFGAPAAQSATALPAHVYAPYFETWTADSLTATAEASGTPYFTLAFLETLSKTSCTLAWNGRRGDRVRNGRYLPDIASLRELGGDVIMSFGGWSADQRGKEIADSCKDVNAIAAAYEDVINRYDVTRLDMDLEGRSLKRRGGIDRRNRALELVEEWAAHQRRPLEVSYTLPTSASGLRRPAVTVLQNAIENGTRVDVVNVMAFDYYDGITTDMGAAAISAADGLLAQLQALYPVKSTAELDAMVGITLMPGVDNAPKKTEKTTVADAQQVLDYATANGFNTVSIWAIQRDKEFSRVLQQFTGK
jgi:Glycosyl hydrolases family 18